MGAEGGERARPRQVAHAAAPNRVGPGLDDTDQEAVMAVRLEELTAVAGREGLDAFEARGTPGDGILGRRPSCTRPDGSHRHYA